MHRLLRPLSFAALALLLLTACGGRRHAAEMLTQAAAVVEQQPDSALRLLKTVTNPRRLPKPLRTDYALRLVQAKDKAGAGIAGDTAIFAAASFYLRQKSSAKAALALFYAGRVRQEQGSPEGATRAYLMAEEQAQATEDYHLRGLINANLGSLNYERGTLDKAIAYSKKALRYFQLQPVKYGNEAWTCVAIGNSYLLKELVDSARLYYKQGLSIAELHRDTVLLSAIYQCIGVTFQQEKELEQARQYFRQAEQLEVSSGHLATLYCNLGYLYFDLHQADSALHYARKILKLHEKDSLAAAELVNAHGLLTALEEQAGNADKALQHSKKQNEQLVRYFSAQRDHSILEVEKKYQNQQLENENSRLLLEKQRFVLLALLLAMLTLAVGAAFYIHRRRSGRKLENAERDAYVLRQLAESLNLKAKNLLDEKQAQLRGIIAQQLYLLKGLPQLELKLKEGRNSGEAAAVISGLVHGKSEDLWRHLHQAINELYGGKLNRGRGLLDEAELKVYALCCAKLDNPEIAILTNLSIKTVQNRRSSIRKKLSEAATPTVERYL
jgi:tetratricopeptide (TPR) repeat protein